MGSIRWAHLLHPAARAILNVRRLLPVPDCRNKDNGNNSRKDKKLELKTVF